MRRALVATGLLMGLIVLGCSRDGLTSEQRAALRMQESEQLHQMMMAMQPGQPDPTMLAMLQKEMQSGPYSLESQADGRVILVSRAGEKPQRYLIDIEQKRLVPIEEITPLSVQK